MLPNLLVRLMLKSQFSPPFRPTTIHIGALFTSNVRQKSRPGTLCDSVLIVQKVLFVAVVIYIEPRARNSFTSIHVGNVNILGRVLPHFESVKKTGALKRVYNPIGQIKTEIKTMIWLRFALSMYLQNNKNVQFIKK